MRTEPLLTAEELAEEWPALPQTERVRRFRLLPRVEREELFLARSAREQAALLHTFRPEERRAWIRLLPPDDVADLAQEVPEDERESLLEALDEASRAEVRALLVYAEDVAGGLMSPRYATLRPDMTVDEAIRYLRHLARERLETIYYVYVIDDAQRLLGVVSFRELFLASERALIRDVMRTDVVTLAEGEDQEAVGRAFREHGLLALPVVDGERRLRGIVTMDDAIDVVEEEATEDAQKAGAVESLGAPYLEVGLGTMVRKRGGWLAVLFVGELFTATAMAFYEDLIARTVVLALFVPLIISSGGNSGAQASTLVVRAMALGEVRLRHWWAVARREVVTGLVLGALLGALGFLRIVLWQAVRPVYGEHALRLATTIGLSLVGVVAFGAVAGSLLPFAFRALRRDPAIASGPFVATLVDVTGLVIYFTVAALVLAAGS